MAEVKCVRCEWMDDWFVIELVEHPGLAGFMRDGEHSMSFYSSARVSDACVEGTSYEMLALATAIEKRESESFKRCAAIKCNDTYLLSSPRNSTRDGVITLVEADKLAASIRAVVGEEGKGDA
jgi:hypothetical protein